MVVRWGTTIFDMCHDVQWVLARYRQVAVYVAFCSLAVPTATKTVSYCCASGNRYRLTVVGSANGDTAAGQGWQIRTMDGAIVESSFTASKYNVNPVGNAATTWVGNLTLKPDYYQVRCAKVQACLCSTLFLPPLLSLLALWQIPACH